MSDPDILTTPAFAVPYVREGGPAYKLRLAQQQQATQLETILAGRAPVPDVATLAAEVSARSTADTALGNRLTAVEPDTAWTTFPIVGAPYMVSATVAGTGGTGNSPTLGIRKGAGSRAYMRGWASASGAIAAGGVLTLGPGHLLAKFRPPHPVTVWPQQVSGTPLRFEVNPDGTMRNLTAITSGTFLNFDGISWNLA